MMHSIIIEDEDIAAIKLQKMIQELDAEIHIARILSSVKESIAYLKEHKPDLIFLDINLSDDNSFEIFNVVTDIKSKIIFTTAYSEYAIKAFELNSIDYLLKPIAKKDLERSLQKMKSLNEIHIPNYKNLLTIEANYKKRFLIKQNNSLLTVTVEEIAYFFSEDKLTFIKLKNNKKLPIDETLKKLETLINPSQFYRINRRYLIHISSIEKMYYSSKSRIILHLKPPAEEQQVTVAIEKLGKFKKWLSD
ncbi:LytR/AlgR family response regulator transcription factor [Tenacibaculum agarivorans]|uniref:LytR/AlgR family response regulator transcription factor n=1 Tax=Tenacibaculum agarivorans TaxID=1908389 RepID=UPI0009FAC73D|nr:LytTR family DNA-binding domain-containing protein [Tenacibaculum agarivorans]